MDLETKPSCLNSTDPVDWKQSPGLSVQIFPTISSPGAALTPRYLSPWALEVDVLNPLIKGDYSFSPNFKATDIQVQEIVMEPSNRNPGPRSRLCKQDTTPGHVGR